ncbi:hypothetical protein AOQ84DRAFT_379161 [Glonium stellatum]|uniref:Uncharacterized protein n=1 Tax=Glonium stellatum TaxID=574774 RepID=A0A8E2JQK6_9PEZI|nr:hypothetical protein AOQ84DRAFT_379161 [Glonium stellatum]
MAAGSQTTYAEQKSELLEVKNLLLNRQHKQCVSRCEELLTELSRDIHIHTASLNFYMALAHDSVARNMPYDSPYRLHTLEQAEKHYVAALTALTPAFKSSDNDKAIREDSDHSDDEGSLTSSSPRSCRSSLSSHRSSMSSNSTRRTSVSDSGSESGSPPKKTVRFCTSPAHVIVTDGAGSPQHSPDACAALGSSKDGHVERYNAHLTDFTNMLRSHIASVRYLKTAPLPTQSDRSKSRDYNPASRARAASQGLRGGMRTTVLELQAWRKGQGDLPPRAKFDNSRYEDLCRQALAEL